MQYPPLTSSLTSAELALDVIRAACGWHIAPVVADTLVVDGNGSTRIALPTKHIESIDRVEVEGRILPETSYRWSADGWITRRDRGVWPDLERSITVHLQHGFSHAPEVLAVMEALVQRIEMAPSGIERSVSVGPFRDEFVVGRGGVITAGLLESEAAALARYRLDGHSRV